YLELCHPLLFLLNGSDASDELLVGERWMERHNPIASNRLSGSGRPRFQRAFKDVGVLVQISPLRNQAPIGAVGLSEDIWRAALPVSYVRVAWVCVRLKIGPQCICDRRRISASLSHLGRNPRMPAQCGDFSCSTELSQHRRDERSPPSSTDG